jgi:stage II sporulation protein M
VSNCHSARLEETPFPISAQKIHSKMVIMRSEERRAYTVGLYPYLRTSLAIFGAGFVIGLIIVARFPPLTDYFQETIATFVKLFAGIPRFKLAGAIFFNNAVKTLLAIVLGIVLGIVPTIFLLANGIALGVAWSVSVATRGPWISLLSLLPHGILELPAVFLGTSIGLSIGYRGVRRLAGNFEIHSGAEMVQGLRYFFTVIIPLLIAAALVEAFITPTLISPR